MSYELGQTYVICLIISLIWGRCRRERGSQLIARLAIAPLIAVGIVWLFRTVTP